MIQVADCHSSPILFGSLSSEIESFMFGETKDDSNEKKIQDKLLYKSESSTFLFGNCEDDFLSVKNDYLVISDYLSAKNDDLLATADLQSKSLH